MKAPRRKIADAVAEKFLKDGVSVKLGQEVAAYLLETNRVGELYSLLRDVQNKLAEAGVVEVTAASAYSLSDSVKAQITQEVKRVYPAAKQIVVTEVTDPGIIGGVRLNFADRQLDLSAEGKLNKFRQLTMAGKE